MAGGGGGFISDVVDVLDAIGDFLGMGAEGATSALDQMYGAKEITNAASDIYDQALGECVTEGQIVLMEEIGTDGFIAAGLDALEEEGEVDLVSLTNHPEAIGEILEGASEELNDVVQSVLEDTGVFDD